MARILVVEDSPDVHRLLVDTLSAEGHRVHGVHDGLQAREMLAAVSSTAEPRAAAASPSASSAAARSAPPFDLVVLDLMLPHVDGSVLLAEFRRHSGLPVLVLSAKDAVYTKVDVLRLGADDYVTKPFDLEELTARVEVLLRRSAPPNRPPALLVHGDLSLDPQHARVTRAGHEVVLTATEFRILELLMTQPGRVLSRPTIYEAVWEEPFVADDAAVKTHLSNLRTKLRSSSSGGTGSADGSADDAGSADGTPDGTGSADGTPDGTGSADGTPDGTGPADGSAEDPIETVWGLGYRMRAVPSAE